VTTTFSCTHSVANECPRSSFYVHHHHGRIFCGESAVDEDFECCDV
jgi:hypothetical protein